MQRSTRQSWEALVKEGKVLQGRGSLLWPLAPHRSSVWGGCSREGNSREVGLRPPSHNISCDPTHNCFA